MAVPFTELAGSPSESFSPQGFTATRQILVAWANRDAMVRELLGDNENFGGLGWAQYPGRSDVKVSGIQSIPWETQVPDAAVFTQIDEDLNGYTGQLAHMTIQYTWLPGGIWPFPAGTIDLGVEAGTHLTYTRRLGGEYRTLPGLHLAWQRSADLPVPKDALQTIRVPTTEHHFTWERVTQPPTTAMSALVGKINDALWQGFKTETLLYEGSTLDRQFIGFPPVDPLADLEGEWSPWKVTHVFRQLIIENVNVQGAQNHAGWNHTWSNVDVAGQPIWDRLVSVAGGETQYQLANFDPLFQNE